jgi:hypothetical protein
VPNKLERRMKEVIESAVQGVGGAQGLVDWVRRSNANERVFWRDIVPRVLPKVITEEKPVWFPQTVEHRIVHEPRSMPDDGDETR